MRLDSLLNGFARRRGGAWVLGGIAALLDGVERLLAVPNKPAQPLPERDQVRALKRTDFFSIRQTKSDLGYKYWVLQGHGVYASFELFDTWREAMAAADERIKSGALSFA